MKPTTLLVDGNNLAMRNIFCSALDDLKAGKVFTGGIYGYLTSLVRMAAAPDVGRIFVFWDAGVPAHRKALLPDYKAKRKERKSKLSEEDLEKAMGQLEECTKVTEMLGCGSLAYADREADDAVAAASRILSEQQQPYRIISTDKDLWQCVNWDAVIYDPLNARTIDGTTFYDLTQLQPHSYLFYRSLCGDRSDEVKGARKCGEVRALDFTSRYSTWLHEKCGVALDCGTRLYGGVNRVDPYNYVGEYITSLPKAEYWENYIIDDRERLSGEYRAIDLSGSFGGTKGLRNTLETFEPKVQVKTFLGFCTRFAFKSVLGDPERFTGPFRRARERVI